jgi:hypothetical protein
MVSTTRDTVDEAERRVTRMLFAVLYGKETGARAGAETLWVEHALQREEIAGLALRPGPRDEQD